jgi:hypothetical protein
MIAAPSQTPALNLRRALITLLGIALALASARMAVQGWVTLPACGWRWLTGLPCPLCGGIRCLDALSHGEILRALTLNPLVFFGLAGGLTVALHSRLRHWMQTQSPARWVRWLSIVALINWFYLIAVLQ